MSKPIPVFFGLLCFLLLSAAVCAEPYRYGRVRDNDGWTNVRESASLDSTVLERVKAGDLVIVTREEGDFYDCLLLFRSVELPETFGFIHKSRVSEISPALGAGIVNDPDGWSYLREGPDTSSRALRKLFPGQGFFVVVSKAGDWYKVKTRDGTVGYIHGTRLEWVIPRN
jgi:uncharacterized protein YgiM (DUF1202 family)